MSVTPLRRVEKSVPTEHRGLLYPSAPTLSARIRAMVAADPERAWSSADLESQLAVSGATLRRHLAAEGQSLRQVKRAI